MSDVAKWALLVVGIGTVLVLILALPIASLVNGERVASLFGQLVSVMSPYIIKARAFVNLFLTPVGRTMFSTVIAYMFLKYFITWPIKLITSVYHWIFK